MFGTQSISHLVAALKLKHELNVYETQTKKQKLQYNISIGGFKLTWKFKL